MQCSFRCSRREFGNKYDPINLILEKYNYDEELADTTSRKSDNEESVDLSDMPPLQCGERESKEGKRLKTLTPDKLITGLPILLAQIKVETIHTNQNMKSDKYYIFCISITKLLKKFTTV